MEKTKRTRKDFQEMALSRVGETRMNNLGSLMTVEKYNGSLNVTVRFIETGNTVRTTWNQFMSGSVKNVYDKSKFGVAYIGEGRHPISIDGEYTPAYLTWSGMLARCYDRNSQATRPTYKGCKVANEWLCFQNFAEWYKENYYEIDGHRGHLDKDILKKGNRIYAPETAVFVPQFINGLFIGRKNLKGDCPIGVKKTSRYESKYEARCNNNKGYRVYLGTYDTPEEAFEVYKEYKEKLIKDIAEEYKGRLPDTLYNAMINYKIEITD